MGAYRNRQPLMAGFGRIASLWLAIVVLICGACSVLTPAHDSDATCKELDGEPYARVGVGERCPSFEVPMTDGSTICSDSLRGKVVLITLWASWCPLCRKEMKAIMERGALDEVRGESNFVWLPIARQENLATVKGWLGEKGYRVVSGYDEDRAVYALFAEQEIPRNILVGRDGTIVSHSVGFVQREFSGLVEEIKTMLH